LTRAHGFARVAGYKQQAAPGQQEKNKGARHVMRYEQWNDVPDMLKFLYR
jgi:hypothetical protein